MIMNCHYTNIGKEDYWSDVLIVEFKDKFELEKYYKNGVGKIDLEAVQGQKIYHDSS